MERQFPDGVSHFITHFGRRGPLKWNTVVYFGDRYTLSMEVDVKVDYPNNTVAPTGKPSFQLNEVVDVEILPNGNASTSFGEQYTFGETKWRKIASDGKGDFSAVGIKLNPRPVPNFHRFKRGELKDRIQIQLVEP